MIKKDFIKIFQKKAGFQNKERAIEVTEAFLESMKDVLLKENKLIFRKFGTFSKVYRKQSNNRNPHNGEIINYKPKLHIKFKTSEEFVKKLNIPGE